MVYGFCRFHAQLATGNAAFGCRLFTANRCLQTIPRQRRLTPETLTPFYAEAASRAPAAVFRRRIISHTDPMKRNGEEENPGAGLRKITDAIIHAIIVNTTYPMPL